MTKILPRILALFLSLCLTLPSPAFALRVQAGAESNEIRDQIQADLANSAAGAEQAKLDPSSATLDQLSEYLKSASIAQAILNEREAKGRFITREDFQKRMYGSVQHIKNPQWDKLSDRLLFPEAAARGSKRRTVIKVVGFAAAALGLGIGAPLFYRWIKSTPPGRLIWAFSPHMQPSDFDPVVERFRSARGTVIYVGEVGPPRIGDLRESHPALARQLTLESLDPARFREDSELGRRLQEVLQQNNRINAALLQRLRQNPTSVRAPRMRQALGSSLPVIEYLTDHPEVQAVWEQPTLESFLEVLRADLLMQEAFYALIRRRDQEAYFRNFADEYRRFHRGTQTLRDGVFGEQVSRLIRENPSATIIVSRGSSHFQMAEEVNNWRELGLEREVIGAETAHPEIHHASLAPHQAALLADSQSTIPDVPEVRRNVLRFIPWFTVQNMLTVGGRMSTAYTFTRATEVARTLTDQDLDDLIASLQRQSPLFDQVAANDYNQWLVYVRLHTWAWLNSRGRLQNLRNSVPDYLRDLTPEQAEQDLRDDIRRRRGPGRQRVLLRPREALIGRLAHQDQNPFSQVVLAAAGAEQAKLNANSASVKQLSKRLKSVPVAQAIVRERQTPRGPFSSSQEMFLERMVKYGNVLGVKPDDWVRFSNRLSFTEAPARGQRRRTVVKAAAFAAAALGLGLGVPLFYQWVKPNPPGRLIWAFGAHIVPSDFDPIVEQLRRARGRVIFVGEFGGLSMDELRARHPDVARQLTRETLDPSRFREDSELGRRLQQVFQEHNRRNASVLRDLKKEPSLLKTRENQKRMGALLPVVEYLTAHPEVQVVWEQPPFEASLEVLRADLAQEEALYALVRRRDREAYFRAFADHHRHFHRGGVLLRDPPFREMVARLLKDNRGATVVVSRGASHWRLAEEVNEWRDLGFEREVFGAEIADPEIYRAALVPFHEQLMADPQATIPNMPEVRRDVLRFIPWFVVQNFLQGSQQLSSRDLYARATTVATSLTDQELEELIQFLQDQASLFDQIAPNDYTNWLVYVRIHTWAWLNSRGKLRHLLNFVPEYFRALTPEQAEQDLRDEIRLRRAPGRPNGFRGPREAMIGRLAQLGQAPFPPLILAAAGAEQAREERHKVLWGEAKFIKEDRDEPLEENQGDHHFVLEAGGRNYLIEVAASKLRVMDLSMTKNFEFGPDSEKLPSVLKVDPSAWRPVPEGQEDRAEVQFGPLAVSITRTQEGLRFGLGAQPKIPGGAITLAPVEKFPLFQWKTHDVGFVQSLGLDTPGEFYKTAQADLQNYYRGLNMQKEWDAFIKVREALRLVARSLPQRLVLTDYNQARLPLGVIAFDNAPPVLTGTNKADPALWSRQDLRLLGEWAHVNRIVILRLENDDRVHGQVTLAGFSPDYLSPDQSELSVHGPSFPGSSPDAPVTLPLSEIAQVSLQAPSAGTEEGNWKLIGPVRLEDLSRQMAEVSFRLASESLVTLVMQTPMGSSKVPGTTTVYTTRFGTWLSNGLDIRKSAGIPSPGEDWHSASQRLLEPFKVSSQEWFISAAEMKMKSVFQDEPKRSHVGLTVVPFEQEELAFRVPMPSSYLPSTFEPLEGYLRRVISMYLLLSQREGSAMLRFKLDEGLGEPAKAIDLNPSIALLGENEERVSELLQTIREADLALPAQNLVWPRGFSVKKVEGNIREVTIAIQRTAAGTEGEGRAKAGWMLTVAALLGITVTGLVYYLLQPAAPPVRPVAGEKSDPRKTPELERFFKNSELVDRLLAEKREPVNIRKIAGDSQFLLIGETHHRPTLIRHIRGQLQAYWDAGYRHLASEWVFSEMQDLIDDWDGLNRVDPKAIREIYQMLLPDDPNIDQYVGFIADAKQIGFQVIGLSKLSQLEGREKEPIKTQNSAWLRIVESRLPKDKTGRTIIHGGEGHMQPQVGSLPDLLKSKGYPFSVLTFSGYTDPNQLVQDLRIKTEAGYLTVGEQLTFQTWRLGEGDKAFMVPTEGLYEGPHWIINLPLLKPRIEDGKRPSAGTEQDVDKFFSKIFGPKGELVLPLDGIGGTTEKFLGAAGYQVRVRYSYGFKPDQESRISLDFARSKGADLDAQDLGEMKRYSVQFLLMASGKVTDSSDFSVIESPSVEILFKMEGVSPLSLVVRVRRDWSLPAVLAGETGAFFEAPFVKVSPVLAPQLENGTVREVQVNGVPVEINILEQSDPTLAVGAALAQAGMKPGQQVRFQKTGPGQLSLTLVPPEPPKPAAEIFKGLKAATVQMEKIAINLPSAPQQPLGRLFAHWDAAIPSAWVGLPRVPISAERSQAAQKLKEQKAGPSDIAALSPDVLSDLGEWDKLFRTLNLAGFVLSSEAQETLEALVRNNPGYLDAFLAGIQKTGGVSLIYSIEVDTAANQLYLYL